MNVLVFEKGGSECTDRTLALALEESMRLDAPLVVATTTGRTAMAALKLCGEKGWQHRLVIVSHAYGTRKSGENIMPEETRKQLLDGGVTVITAAHALSGAERALSTKFGGAYPVEIIAHTLRMLSQGVKVVVEIGAMAMDAGAVPYGKPIVAVGGTGSGADTAAILTPATSQDILATRLHQILCKPY